ncbi:MAG: hypothetical protein ABSH31_04690 [Bryobacteraceae bacterium]
MKELAKDAKEAHKQKVVRVSAPSAAPDPAMPAGAPAGATQTPNWQKVQEAFERGRRSEHLKSYGPAIEAFTEIIELDAKNDSAYLHRGYAKYYLGDYTSGVADLTQSLALQPDNSGAYAMRASALAASGEARKRWRTSNRPFREIPAIPKPIFLRATLHEQLGRAGEALNDYAQAVQLASDSERAYLGRAALLRAHGKVQDSLAD